MALYERMGGGHVRLGGRVDGGEGTLYRGEEDDLVSEVGDLDEELYNEGEGF